jgi:hypothetical protein
MTNRIDQISKLCDWDASVPNYFSDSEQANDLNKTKALTEALTDEIERVRGVQLLYWESLDGQIREIDELEDSHLCCIPRHLFKHGVIESPEQVPERIRQVLNQRGYVIKVGCFVVKRWS